MDPAVLQSQIAALHKCMAKGTDSFDQWRVSGDFLENFQEGLVPDIPGFQEAWELARDIHCTVAMDVFGLHSAMIHELYPSPFASPVSAPVLLPLQPAEVAKLQPAEVAKRQAAEVAKLQPAKVAKLQPAEVAQLQPDKVALPQPPAAAEVALPQHAAATEVALPQHAAATEVALPQHSADEFLHQPPHHRCSPAGLRLPLPRCPEGAVGSLEIWPSARRDPALGPSEPLPPTIFCCLGAILVGGGGSVTV